MGYVMEANQLTWHKLVIAAVNSMCSQEGNQPLTAIYIIVKRMVAV